MKHCRNGHPLTPEIYRPERRGQQSCLICNRDYQNKRYRERVGPRKEPLGMRHPKAQKAWISMRFRCNNKNAKCWPDYGGRGIKVCERWGRFASFLEDMGDPPPGTSLDRINNDGDYEPGNCRWATPSQQQLNRRANRLITINGETKPLSAWARLHMVRPELASLRLLRGWDEVSAVTKPPRKKAHA